MSTTRLLLAACLSLSIAAPSCAADSLVLSLELNAGTSDCPMIVAWLVDADNRFVRTLHVFTKDRKYYKDLTSWMKSRGSQESDKDLDAVIGPTIKWKATGTVSIPLRSGKVDLLSGAYSIRFEQAKDKGGHYKSTKVALTKDFTGVTQSDQGYIKTLTVAVK